MSVFTAKVFLDCLETLDWGVEQVKVYVVYRETYCQDGFIDKRLVAIFSKQEYAIAYCERQAIGLDVYWYDTEYVDSEVEK